MYFIIPKRHEWNGNLKRFTSFSCVHQSPKADSLILNDKISEIFFTHVDASKMNWKDLLVENEEEPADINEVHSIQISIYKLHHTNDLLKHSLIAKTLHRVKAEHPTVYNSAVCRKAHHRNEMYNIRNKLRVL